MDIQKQCNREAFEKYAASRCYYLNKNSDGSYCKANTALAWEIWREASAVPDGFVLVPKTDVHDHYVAEHLKDTTCSVDVSELTGNFGDRIYGKLRPYDCIGSDGNTLLYDLESSNFNMQRHAGSSGDYVLVPKELAKKVTEGGRTDLKIIDQTIALVDILASSTNCYQRDPQSGVYPFESNNPRVMEWWRAACQIQELLTNTDPENCDFEEYKAAVEAAKNKENQ